MQSEEKFWDKLSDKFDHRSRHFQKTNDRLLERTKGYLKPSDMVLDLGCATGTMSIAVSGLVQGVRGVDISSKMIQAAKMKARDAGVRNVDFFQGDIFAPQLERGSFDVVLAFNVFLHLPDTLKATQRIWELLKPGGLVISVTACLAEKGMFINALLRIVMAGTVRLGLLPRVHFFAVDDLTRLMADQHLEPVQVELIRCAPAVCFIVAKKG